jgi:hypothetical protein
MTATAKTAVTASTSALTDGQSADAADVTTPLGELLTQLKSGQVAISANDTHVKHLEDAIVATAGQISVVVGSEGGNETLAVNLDASGQSAGKVPVTDGSNGWSWQTVSAAGAESLDMTVTAGETLAERDYVYVDLSSGTAFKVDTNATPIKCGAVRGFVVTPGGIANAASGLIRLQGEVSGFSGLTAWAEVWASTTAGGYTQTKPTVAADNVQVAVIRAGVAISTQIVLALPGHVEYMKRNSMISLTTMTIEHHSDPQARTRQAAAFVTAAGPYEEPCSIRRWSGGSGDVSVRFDNGSGSNANTNTTFRNDIAATVDLTCVVRLP